MQKRMLIAAWAIALVSAVPALAQNSVRTAGEKITGAAYREQSSQAYWSGAYSNASALHDYSRSYSYIPAETAEEHTAEVRRNVTAAKKELSKLGPKAKQNKTLAKHIDTLNSHYDKTLEHASAIDKEAGKNDKADVKKLHESTTGLTDSLKSAEAEHKKLAEHLKSEEKK